MNKRKVSGVGLAAGKETAGQIEKETPVPQMSNVD
jgi:hypothetical protein